ncbi:hypothetical protein SAMN07250955_10818 [Arboricoccus pini]|uniref:Uncharacterized protein n=1 Tax=Arboricoccus pini TaxID=1963835 RepID=A0A212RF54_9PROT|nr:hypothetical protein [Arboricoccus pini]SNB70899.1 hypothetical protein SAMN07250955_10818 [Arboricoccus pini]
MVAFWDDGALKTLFGFKKLASKAGIICAHHDGRVHAKLYVLSSSMVVTSAYASNRGIGFVEPAMITECGIFHGPDTVPFREGAQWLDVIWKKSHDVDSKALAADRAAWV